ncbi:MAG TPA: radical SAM family heme chaperone HemW, partial [Gemmatimonadales bacterium]|nr:radical SAM family heme chaperone HemW [Gemmatimonadales bacterium]
MHLYFHVPFCTRRCSYCDFAITVRREAPSDAYVEAVLEEWNLWQADPIWAQAAEVQTVYFGGGTPSKVTPAAIRQVLDRVAADRAISPDAEITLEANPEDVTPSSAVAWHSAGVNRVSLGVQSFDPAVLSWMHRTHTADQVPRSVEALRCAGIADLSIDLIFGLPTALGRDWTADLGRALALEPEHLSIYGLTIEAQTPLGRWTGRGDVIPAADERCASEFLQAHSILAQHGYEHYEVSNAGRPGHRARHNSAYWRRAPFIGLGPAAHSGAGNERRWNVRDWVAYQRLISTGRSPQAGREILDAEAVALEELYLGLRTIDGVPLDRVPPASVAGWRAEGWARVEGDRLQLTPEGWLRLDALVPSIRP